MVDTWKVGPAYACSLKGVAGIMFPPTEACLGLWPFPLLMFVFSFAKVSMAPLCGLGFCVLFARGLATGLVTESDTVPSYCGID